MCPFVAVSKIVRVVENLLLFFFGCLRSKIHPVNKKPSVDTEGFLF